MGAFFSSYLGTIWLKKDIWLSSSYKNAKKITMKGRNFRIMGANIWVRVICAVFLRIRGVIGVKNVRKGKKEGLFCIKNVYHVYAGEEWIKNEKMFICGVLFFFFGVCMGSSGAAFGGGFNGIGHFFSSIHAF